METWNKYTFGMNDENGRLIQISVPARTRDDAYRMVKQMLFFKCAEDDPRWNFWLNDEEEY